MLGKSTDKAEAAASVEAKIGAPTMCMPRLVVVTPALLALLCALQGCARTGGAQGPTTTLTIAQMAEPRSMNPLYLDGYIAGEINGLLFSFLTTYDLSGNTIGQAARVPTVENGGISRDGLTYTFHLRHDIRWQDGAKLTSRDVAFTYDAIMNPRNNTLSTYGYDAVAWVRTPDPYTVVVHLKYRLAPFVTYFFGGNSNYPILPAHVLAQYPDLNHVPFNADPVGSGPYRLVEWSRGDHMTFAADPSYYLGAPHIPRIVIDFIPNSETIMNELTTGEVNAVFFADVSQIARLRALPAHRIQTSSTTLFGTILFNTTSEYLDDPKVRRAFAIAIDRDSMVRKITQGVYDPATGMRGLFSWAFDPSAGNVPYDPAAASALLASDGWSPGPNGVLHKNGAPLVVQLLFATGSTFSSDFANVIAGYERAIGISVQLKGLSPDALTDPSGPLYSGKYQASLFTEESQADPDARWILGCSQRAPHGFNFMRYCNPKVDAVFESAAATFDMRERKSDYAFVQRRLLADLPIDFLYQVVEVDVVPDRLRDYEASMYTSPYTFVNQWRL